jgi:hypothetical protein
MWGRDEIQSIIAALAVTATVEQWQILARLMLALSVPAGLIERALTVRMG